jgi:DNA-binding SARP family transcriptional activator
MDSPLSSNQGTLTVASEASSLTSLLERGIHCTRQGYYAEGVTFFALARERLSPDQMHFAVVLDVLIQSHAGYLQAQHALHVASKRFVKADADQQAQLVALEKLLLIPGENTDGEPPPHTETRPPENSWSHQPPQSPQLLLADSSIEKLPQPLRSPSRDGGALPALCFTCFGRFEVRRMGRLIALCPSRNGQVILRYLVAQPGHSATIDALMAMLWPEDEQGVAQPKLHIAISALRRSLNEGHISTPGCGYIVCKNRIYYLNPEAAIRTDVDEFLQCYRAERQTDEGRAALYERACRLYTGPFLSEDMYADWSFLQREQLSRTYLAMCGALTEHYLKTSCYEEAAKWATAMLKENRCDEAAHRQLIQIYAAQGRRSEALQQYQRCERVLREELGMQPLPETQTLFQALLANEPLPN